ncbi:UDP-forming cellulose synthase catalytic subunit [Lichenihabitans psoromatis]|uniref:UDP-forming cellulose synthase catalytic subunit n=1 Tax=Lichenihabitans psoromatis TaxID=2528642 RepID=UPI001FE0983D|nr:UDP-forming cellulose synthase catalytic subunit [Lichenihabitans psoromatis]
MADNPSKASNSVIKALTTINWLIIGVLYVVLAIEPVSIQAQFVLGSTAILGMALIRTLRLTGPWRNVFLALGTAVVLRYFYWRTTSTLPPVSDTLNFVCGLTLWIAEMYSAIMLAISLFVIADPLERKPARRLSYDEMPTVDVFVPTYNEDHDLLAITLAAATRLEYPADKLRVHLLDDGGTDQKCNSDNAASARVAKARRADLMDLAADMGVTYHTRAKNLHAKAGNMNSALANTNGELIVVFDADHVPMPDFLLETVGHFRTDPRLFLCQSPHFFANPDPLENNLQTYTSMPSENEMFYGVIQKGLDKWNAAFFCGSAAVLRRAALEEVGGFSGISITEDCETALDLHSRGWNSIYVDKPMISGLQPETFASFIGQRSRWCRGMFQIFLLKNPAFKRGLSVAQKICYLSNMSYWFFPIFRLPFLIAPLLYIWFSMQIYVANTREFFAYTMLYMAANMMMQNYLYGKVRWPWVSELYEYVQSIYLVQGLFSVILNPRKPTFNVTDKGLTLDKDHLSELAMPYFVIFGIVVASGLWALLRLFTEPNANELLIVVSGWNFFNLLLSGAALGVVSERKTNRTPIKRVAELAVGTAIVPVLIIDVSTGGCRVEVEEGLIPRHLQKGAAGILDVPLRKEGTGTQTLPVELIRRGVEDGESYYEFEFKNLRADNYRLLVDLMYAGSDGLEAFRSKRRRQKSIFGGIFGFFRWGLTEPVRGFRVMHGHIQEVRLAKAKLAASLAAITQSSAEPGVEPSGSANAPPLAKAS